MPSSSDKKDGKLCCDACDGPHLTAECPLYKGKARDKHKDGQKGKPKDIGSGTGGNFTLTKAKEVRMPPDGRCGPFPALRCSPPFDDPDGLWRQLPLPLAVLRPGLRLRPRAPQGHRPLHRQQPQPGGCRRPSEGLDRVGWRRERQVIHGKDGLGERSMGRGD